MQLVPAQAEVVGVIDRAQKSQKPEKQETGSGRMGVVATGLKPIQGHFGEFLLLSSNGRLGFTGPEDLSHLT